MLLRTYHYEKLTASAYLKWYRVRDTRLDPTCAHSLRFDIISAWHNPHADPIRNLNPLPVVRTLMTMRELANWESRKTTMKVKKGLKKNLNAILERANRSRYT